MSAQPSSSPFVAPRSRGAQIGPNAVLQTLRAVREMRSAAMAEEVRALANLPDPLPEGMIPEPWFVALLASVRAWVPEPEQVLGRAGLYTAAYVRDNRIPAPIRRTLKMLPSRAALPLLLNAFRRNAWTFAGAGEFDIEEGYPHVLTLRGAPSCRPEASPPSTGGGSYYEGAFEELLHLAAPNARVTEIACAARGAPRCRFEISLSGSRT